MVFEGEEGLHFTFPHNDPLVIEMKVTSAIVRRILIHTGSSVDITWDCLKKLKYLRREIIALVHPILGFGGREAHPAKMIHLPLRLGDKVKARNLEVEFLVVDIPTAYNVILRRPTLHKLKDVIAPYLLYLKLTMEALTKCKGTNEWPENATSTNTNARLAENRKKEHKQQLRILYTKHPDPHHYCCPRAPHPRDLHHQKMQPYLGHLCQLLGFGARLGVDNDPPPLLVESIRSQDHQEFPKELRTTLTAPPVALLLRLSRFFSFRSSALERASSRKHCRSPFSAFKAFFSFFTFSRWCLYLATESFDFWHSAWMSMIRFSRTQTDESKGKQNGKIEGNRIRFGLTSAMGTCSLVTFSGSAELEGARIQDLVKFSTKAYLTEGSATKKSTAWA
ncbi:LOW QUALITY PROTEIN: hypothetical protein Cgig2_021606 [Carnegiea gigantea]|uniref:Uncharacterized protein n=1 Tax=Carnegiea gigantea TaxID=171969 RepID=A0A9Q1GMB6_9CARY|nr:LOW QUALITY PROTEIN: hypothetical protein Cgig2_021606 [Carnegiea gigantea]